jgi:hypothetical protein
MLQLSPDASSLFKGRHFEHSIIILCIRWYITYKLSYRDLVEMMAERGVELSHTTILRWVQRYVPEFEKRWTRFAGPVGSSWRVDETYSRVRGDRVLSFVADNHLLFITGADQGGKSSLAKMLYRDLQDKGLIPVLVNGSDIKSFKDNELMKVVDRAFVHQYGSNLNELILERYRQLGNDRKLLIIDDFDHMPITNRHGHNIIIEEFRKNYPRIIVFANLYGVSSPQACCARLDA